MEYLNVGTDRILEEYFYPVVNTDKLLKPAGGFWCTNHLSPYYNEWIDFIMSKPVYFTRYMGKENPFSLTGAVVTLKDDARVLSLDNPDSLGLLSDKYKYDFEAVSTDFDAIYFDVYKLFSMLSKYGSEVRRYVTVNTMLLMNLECIDHYKAARIELEPFDYSYEYDYGKDASMQINVSDTQRFVEPASPIYLQLLEDIYKKLQDIIFNIKKNNRNLPNYAVVELVRNEILSRFGDFIKSYVEFKGYDEFRIANSLAIKSFRSVK